MNGTKPRSAVCLPVMIMLSGLAFLGFARGAAAAAPPELADRPDTPPHHHHNLGAGMQYTNIAVATGPWEDPATWNTNSIPADNAVVMISTGFTVTLNSKQSARLALVDVYGTLQFSSATDTQMFVETIEVGLGGRFLIADAANPLPANLSSQVVFINQEGQPILPTTADPEALREGLVAIGPVQVYGAFKTPYAVLSTNAVAAGSAFLPIANVPSDWQVGDHLVVPATTFRENAAQGVNTPLQNERVTITGINPNGQNGVAVSANLQYGHDVDPSMTIQIPNLDRNVVFQSSNTGTLYRGHAMLMDCSSSVVKGAEFLDMGRTDKGIPLNDPVWNGDVLQTGTGANPRGRYALHFHMCGLAQSQALVYDSVVSGVPGWGMVNHDSNVQISSSIVYDFGGAGFVSEDGDELGAFQGDMAVGGYGNYLDPLDNQYELRQTYWKIDPTRLAVVDMGFHGDGFWLQSPAVTLSGNVAAGNHGKAFFSNLTGVRAYEGVGLTKDIVGQVYKSWGKNAPNPDKMEYWKGTSSVVVQELPLLSFNNNAAYGNFECFMSRYNQAPAEALIVQIDDDCVTPGAPQCPTGLNIEGDIVKGGGVQFVPQAVSNLSCWNNSVGVNVSYGDLMSYENVFIGADDALSVADPGACGLDKQVWVGWEGYFFIHNQTLDTVTIKGYPIPILTATGAASKDYFQATLTDNVDYVDEQDQICGTKIDGKKVAGAVISGYEVCVCDNSGVRR